MPPQYSSISCRAVMPAGASLTPGVLDPARDREAARPLAAVAALAGEPLGPLLDDVAHPVEGLDVVEQGRPAEEPDLRREGRLLPRQPALALDAFEHRRLFAADIGAGAAAEVNPGMPREPAASIAAISLSRIAWHCGYSSRR